MTNLTRWQPIREMMSLREAMDRFLEDSFSREIGVFEGAHFPLIDMYQTDNDVIVKAIIPGIKSEDLNISVTGDVLTINGEVHHEEETKGKQYHMREARYGAFTRTIPLPISVNSDKASAQYEDGVLTLTLPKKEEVRPKTITVKAR